MIQTLFGEVKGFLSKDFLFASLLPTIVFVASVGATLGGIIGFEGSLSWIDSWTEIQKLTVSVVAFVGTVVFAYIISGLRVAFLRLWSGLVRGPLTMLLALGEWWNRKAFDEASAKAYRLPEWQPILDEFAIELQKVWNKTSNTVAPVPSSEYEELKGKLRTLMKATDPMAAKGLITQSIIPAYQKYKVDKRLEDLYVEVARVLEQRAKEEAADIISRMFQLDRQYGSRESIRGTRLGNVVESFYAYSFSRYGMEGEVMWPHLQSVISDKFATKLAEMKIILDFCLTMASLAILYAILAVMGGPWLWFNLQFWAAITSIAVIVSYTVYYRLGVLVAIQYGDLVRASFDLFRKDLLKNLAERNQSEVGKWESISRLLAYGQGGIQSPQRMEEQGQKEDQSQATVNNKAKSFLKALMKKLS